MTGWAAVTGHLSLIPLLLMAIIALWTVPHYWSLAMSKKMEYDAAGIPATPGSRTGWLMALSAFLLCLASVLLAQAADLGLAFIAASLIVGALLLALVLRYLTLATVFTARHIYYGSIFYLVALFTLILANSVLA